MKAFLEEYGLIIVAVIVVALLVVLAIYFGNTAKTNVKSTFDDFNSTTKGVVDAGLGTASGVMSGINSETTGMSTPASPTP